jgi:uncharacterized protein YndB with AHSA1/START domain
MTTEHESKPVEHRGRKIEREIRIQAPADRVWEAWADPVKISQWFTDRAGGFAEPGATITWFFDAFHFHISYQVLCSEPGKSYTIRWEEPPPGREPGVLEIKLSQAGGVTTMRLVESGFREGAEWNEEYEGVSSGWTMALALLKNYAENYFGQARASWLLLRPAAYTKEQVVPLQRTEAGLARWLTRSGSLGATGEPFRLVLQSGETLSGRVLAVTKSETCVSWDEVGGALEFKAFAMGPQKMVGLRASAWAGGAARLEAAKPAMEAALDRCAAVLAAH